MKHKLINKTREGAGLPYKNDGGGGGGVLVIPLRSQNWYIG